MTTLHSTRPDRSSMPVSTLKLKLSSVVGAPSRVALVAHDPSSADSATPATVPSRAVVVFIENPCAAYSTTVMIATEAVSVTSTGLSPGPAARAA